MSMRTRRPESEQFLRLAKTAKQAIWALSSMEPDAVRRTKGRSKPGRVFRQSLSLLIGLVAVCGVGRASGEANQAVQAEVMRDSVVCLITSAYDYNVAEPWKRRSLSDRWVCASAVGPYQVITTAQSVANHTFLKALRYGQAEYVSAVPRVVDYESDLCLIELDPNELREPLQPLCFSGRYAKGAEVAFHWLAPDSTLNRGQGYLDRVHVQRVRTSYGQRLRYVIANTSRKMGFGELYYLGSAPLGIGCWAGDNREADLIPAETIACFLSAVKADEPYQGFGEIGFDTSELRDPAMRSALQLPASLRDGAYVSNVYNLGTGADSLLQGDVVLDIDGHTVDPYGRFADPNYGPLALQHLITRKAVGQSVQITIWRAGKRAKLDEPVRTFKPSEMLVPFQEYDRQPEYIIIGGFVFQKLTREYLMAFGKNPSGQAPPHLYQYFQDMAFKPTDERKGIMVLSHVLPAPTNLGYTGLGELVVETFNGRPVASVADIMEACDLDPKSPHHIVEFEMDAPTVVIPRQGLSEINSFVAQNYGIQKLSNSHL